MTSLQGGMLVKKRVRLVSSNKGSLYLENLGGFQFKKKHPVASQVCIIVLLIFLFFLNAKDKLHV